MTFVWRYPLFLIPLEGGYVSVVEGPPDESATHLLAVFTTSTLAESFMNHCQIPGVPKPLLNAREFGWLLQSLRHPVTRVAFDPQPASLTVQSRWDVSVEELLTRHLVPDNSPWNYPVFVLQEPAGYASIEGQSADGSRWTAIAIFSSREKAEAYRQVAASAGTVCEIANMAEARTLLGTVTGSVSAVALDPTVCDGRYAAPHCFSLRTILDKYLVPTRP
jgi:hypothetical protein